MTPLPAAIIGGWEIVLILIVLGIPIAIVVAVLLIVRFTRRDRRAGGTPPPLPNDPKR